MTSLKLSSLVGKDLSGFTILGMTEVYMLDDDGMMSRSIGFFKSRELAEMFAGTQTTASRYRTRETIILTDDDVGYIVGDHDPVNLFDDEEEVVKNRDAVLARLSSPE